MLNINLPSNYEIALSETTTTPAQIKVELQSLFDNQKEHKDLLLMTIRWTLANSNAKGINTDEIYRLFTRVATNEMASQPMIDNFIMTYTIVLASNNLQFM
jgi:hypothetical protein